VVDRKGLWWSAHGEQSSSEMKSGGDGGSGARGEMRMQEEAKWRERELLKVLDQKRRRGEACTGASHDGGKVAAGQSSGRGGATWSAREKARGEELGQRPTWGRRVGGARAGGGARRAAAACDGKVVVRSGGKAKASRKG
jgi:hypothetical protein